MLGEHTGGTGEVPLCLRQEEKVLDGLILRWSCSVIEALSTCGKKVRGGGDHKEREYQVGEFTGGTQNHARRQTHSYRLLRPKDTE